MAKIGIDLGTTNSVATYYDGVSTQILLNSNSEELTPSVVAPEDFEGEEEGEYLVGRSAVSQAKLAPRNTIFSIKRLMGRSYNDEDVQRWKAKVAYEIKESTDPIPGRATVTMMGKTYLPEEISAMILSEIKRYAEQSLRKPVTHAVITVPAYFKEPERAATREAGRLAGLVVKTLLPEPTSAAIAFGTQTRREGSFVLVFDLGGGTFDISIISIVNGDYNVIEISGDPFLGGDDFDMEIVQLILNDVKQKDNVDLSNDSRFLLVAKEHAERAKRVLSQVETTNIVIPEEARVAGKVINVRMKLTRDEFEKSIKKYVTRCRDLVKASLDTHCLSPELIDDVLLVGGSTAVPAVSKAMEDMFGAEKVSRSTHPMYSVAVGAGIYAHRMLGVECPQCKNICDESESNCSKCGTSLSVAKSVTEGMTVTEITANHFGIQVVSGNDPHTFRPLVEKGTPLPMTSAKRETFYTAEEKQSLIRVPVYEGLGSSVLDNKKIGVIEYPLPGGMPKNHPIHVELRLDRQSLVTVIIEVEGRPGRAEKELTRDFVDEADSKGNTSVLNDDEDISPEDRNLAILDSYIARSEQFLVEYDNIIAEYRKKQLREALAVAQQTLDQNRADSALEAAMGLERVLVRTGTAHLLDQALVIAHAADQTVAQELLEAVEQLRNAAERHESELELKLSEPLAKRIRQIHQQMQGLEHIDAAIGFGGLLRDRAGDDR